MASIVPRTVRRLLVRGDVSLGEEVGKGAELGLALHLGAVLLIGVPLIVFVHSADRELQFAPARIVLDDLRLQLLTDWEKLPQLGAARCARGGRADEAARIAPRRAEHADL